MRGPQLRLRREKLRLSQQTAALIVGLTPTQLSRIENDHATASLALMQILSWLERHPEDIDFAIEEAVRFKVIRIQAGRNKIPSITVETRSKKSDT